MSDSKTEVKWFKDGKLLSPSKNIFMEMKGKTRQLVLDSVDRKDAGEYMCEAGKEKLVFKINVAGMNKCCLKVIYSVILNKCTCRIELH